MPPGQPDTDALLVRARKGDHTAVDQLLLRNRASRNSVPIT